jgi:putative redox protein
VILAGRPFTIRRQFLDDVRGEPLRAKIHDLHRPLLVLHGPTDDVVGIENAKQIFEAARHPKSFVSLDGADHLLTRREDAVFVAELIRAWCERYLAPASQDDAPVLEGVRVRATGQGRFQQTVEAGSHRIVADEPEALGGLGSGPTPYDLLSAALGTCTSMTFQLYAERKGWQLPSFSVTVRHMKVHAKDCAACVEDRPGLVDHFERLIRFDADPGEEVRNKAIEIAGKCPVHRTLEYRSTIVTAVSVSENG